MSKVNKTKNKYIVPALVLVVIVAVVLASTFIKSPVVYKGLNLNEPNNNLDFDAFKEKLETAKEKELVFLTLFTDTKEDATLYKKMLENILKDYDFPNYYVYYTNEMTKEENKDLSDILGGPVNAYPLTFVFQNKEIIGNIWGYQLENSYLEELGNIIKLENYIAKDENSFFDED